MCPVELMGSHSVMPATMPKSKAFSDSMKRFISFSFFVLGLRPKPYQEPEVLGFPPY